jgi:RNA polymerase sigma factor (sigma-70 family)
MRAPLQTPGLVPGCQSPLTLTQRALVADNLKVARWAVRRYYPTLRSGGPDFDDAVAVASLGLVEAARRYDPGRSSFMTYALYWCRDGLRRWWAARHRRGLRSAGRAARVVSLDREVGGRSISASLRAPCVSLTDRHDAEVVFRALADLPARQRAAVDLTLLQGLTLIQAGRRLGVSGERVRQVREKAVSVLRARCGATSGHPGGAGPDNHRSASTGRRMSARHAEG